jgi:serine/threonine protein kinase
VESLLCYASEAERFMEAPETAGAETQAPDLLAEGQELGSYKILSMLGAGGMGKVYLAKDTRLGRTVAIKVLERAKVADAERKRRFMQEARSASALNHPNIVTLYDIATDSGTDFLVMEYVEGQTLHRRIPTKGLSIKDSIGYAKQIVSALAAAHAAGIVHRDIKPANVMVTENGTIKILDFGLAKLAEAEQPGMESPTDVGHTREGVIIGTASYMSPEQAAGKRVDARSDIFAVGVVLYEMLTGRRAFDRGTVLATLGAVMYEEPVPVNQIVKSAPLELARVIERCLRKDPDRRIQTMADLRVALEELHDSPPTVTTTEPEVKRGRSRLLWAVAGVVMAAAAVAIYVTRPDETPSAALSDLQFRRLTDVDGWEVLPGWNSDGTMIAFGNNKDGNMDLFIMPVASTDPQQITQTPWDEVAPRWSPDFKYLAFVADRGLGSRLYVMPALGGAERELADSGVLSADHFAGSLDVLGSTPWSRDSALLLYTQVSDGGRTAIWRINPNDLSKFQVTRPGPGESDSSAAWSFDGTRIAFIRSIQDQGSQIWTARPDGSDAKLLAKNVGLGGPSWSADDNKILFSSQNQVWEVDVDSQKLRRITNSPSPDWFPVLSAKGRLAYVKFSDHRVDLYKARFRPSSNPHELFTDDTSENFFPSFSGDGQNVVYQTDRTGNQEIYLRRIDRTGERNLTSNPAEDLVPSFAPDGSDEIVFVSNRDGGKFRVYVMGGGGESPRLLTSRLVPALSTSGWSSGSVSPHWSPDGKKIGFIGIADDNESALFVVDRDGKNERHLLKGVSNFDWYRDDRHIVLSRKGKEGLTQVVGLDLETKRETLLIPTPALEPAMSRDGRNLLYTKAESHFNMNLWVLPLRPDANGMPVAAGDSIQVTDGRSRWHAHKGAWSPDGRTIMYTRDSDQGDIYTIENYK